MGINSLVLPTTDQLNYVKCGVCNSVTPIGLTNQDLNLFQDGGEGINIEREGVMMGYCFIEYRMTKQTPEGL